jgi:hypothetical protein
MSDIAEQVDELCATLGVSRREARKLLVKTANRSTTDGISRLSHADPTAIAALRSLDRQQRGQRR